MKKIHLDGTHRVRRPEETWAIIDGLRAAFGVTRVADATGLDSLGVPVAMAVRPAARTLPVSPGAGSSPLLARISAVMESVELWHAEYACPVPGITGTPAGELGLPYDVRDLRQRAGSLLSERTPLDWVAAADAVSGAATWVPRPYVTIDHQVSDGWQPPLLHSSPHGLAGGNSYGEAVTHALYELIERDCTAPADPAATTAGRHCTASAAPAAASPGRRVDPSTVDDPVCRAALGRITGAGAWTGITEVPNRWGLPCFVADIRSEDFPGPAVGSGVHSSPAVALSRAVSGAVQSRLTAITGVRDDPAVPPSTPGSPGADRVPVQGAEHVPWREVAGPSREFAEDTEEMRWLAGRVRELTGRPPVVVDLSTESAFSVVKVVATGLADGDVTRHAAVRAPAPGAAS
ncbi:YcaO-like family protein [Streptomyces sp. NPDC047967]|uniref:YcaO-like family protein n=1 Tax=Streptomyces sp. NPDC047967 TaxID=3154924 RepID=UPI0033FF1938